MPEGVEVRNLAALEPAVLVQHREGRPAVGGAGVLLRSP
jgi:hypothetical protein